jgi:hypothetical protein
VRRAVPRLAGLAEIAALLAERAGKPKVSRAYAGKVAKRPDFPQPLQRLAATPVWVEAEVVEYIATPRKPGRKRKTGQQTTTTEVSDGTQD